MGEGKRISTFFYRTTTKSLPYKNRSDIQHDNVIKSGKLTTLMASFLPIDTVFQKMTKKQNNY